MYRCRDPRSQVQALPGRPPEEQAGPAGEAPPLLQVRPVRPPYLHRALPGAARVRHQLQLGVHRVQGLLKVPGPLRRGQDAVLRPVRQRVSDPHGGSQVISPFSVFTYFFL